MLKSTEVSFEARLATEQVMFIKRHVTSHLVYWCSATAARDPHDVSLTVEASASTSRCASTPTLAVPHYHS